MGFEKERDAERVLEALPKRFERYGLKVHAGKTRQVRFGRPQERDDGEGGPKPETFDFLGFTHYWAKSRRGRWVVMRKTARQRLSRALKAIGEWCRRHRHRPLREQQGQLARKLQVRFLRFCGLGCE